MISVQTPWKCLAVMQAKNCSVLSKNFREKCQQCEILCSLTYFPYRIQNSQKHVILPTYNVLVIYNLSLTMYKMVPRAPFSCRQRVMSQWLGHLWNVKIRFWNSPFFFLIVLFECVYTEISQNYMSELRVYFVQCFHQDNNLLPVANIFLGFAASTEFLVTAGFK